MKVPMNAHHSAFAMEDASQGARRAPEEAFSIASPRPDLEVVATAKRRQFSQSDRRRILVSRIANSLKKRRRESTPYGVANARKVSNLAALCALSGADFAAFLFQPVLPCQIFVQRTNDSGH